jgi:hypothetical protein
MRIMTRGVAAVLATLVLGAGLASPVDAQSQEPRSKSYAKRAPQNGSGSNAAGRGDGYREQLADKLPIGSLAWWEQMRREGRLGGETR